MAQEENEELLVCWDNFNENLLTGFSESLFRGEFLDVTLAAEGHFIEAHRLILSVGSPFFQKMFTLMPSNQRAIVFLKDVAYSTLKSLTQYLYCGEVNIEAGALPAFISAANALEIKGIVEETPPPAQPVRYEPKPAQSELAANVNDMVGYLQQQIQQQQALPLPQPKNNQKRFKQRYIGLESTESKRLKSIPKSKADDPELNSLPANVVPYESKPKPACSYTIGDVVQVTDLNEEVSHHGYYNGNEENDNSSYAEGIASGAASATITTGSHYLQEIENKGYKLCAGCYHVSKNIQRNDTLTAAKARHGTKYFCPGCPKFKSMCAKCFDIIHRND